MLVQAQKKRAVRRFAEGIGEITNDKPRFGCEWIHALLKRECWQINLKRDHCL